MEDNQINILNDVRGYLIRKGEEFEWINSSTDPNEKIGIAFVQFDSTLPCSFLFTWDKEEEILSLDVLFASKISVPRQVEMSLILSRLNYTLSKGRFVLDFDGGYVLYRQSASMANGLNLSHEQRLTMISNMERQGLKMAELYASLLEDEFSDYV